MKVEKDVMIMKIQIVVLLMVVAGLAFFAGAGPCRGAETWEMYYQSETEKYYYDKSTMTRTPQGIVALSKKVTSLATGGEETQKSIEGIEMNCKAHAYRVVPEKPAEGAASKDTVPAKGKGTAWIDFSLQSTMGSLFQNVCEKAKGKEIPKEIY
jgi:hypothetical protein